MIREINTKLLFISLNITETEAQGHRAEGGTHMKPPT